MAATIVTSLAALSGAALAHGASRPRGCSARPERRGARRAAWPGSGLLGRQLPDRGRSAAAWTQGDTAEANALQQRGLQGWRARAAALEVGRPGRQRRADVPLGGGREGRSRPARAARRPRRLRDELRRTGIPLCPCLHRARVGLTTVRVAFTHGSTEYAVAIAAAERTDIGGLQRALARTAARVAGR